jgi:hypothetical protein
MHKLLLYSLPCSESNDPEFDEFNRNFEGMEKAVEGLLKDSKVFADNVISTLTSLFLHLVLVRFD